MQSQYRTDCLHQMMGGVKNNANSSNVGKGQFDVTVLVTKSNIEGLLTGIAPFK